ncbi:HNH endonuclease signature motif containing protein [Phaeobacter piscinae]|uniref:HNH endonuclease signature motif containing protein n=1 Tax=Phaeobacter piscinae TaxID=1580596 RepID=UPI000C9C8678|nr:HNH endonuclease signature motif containing protein [Phaeobacter piscinae]AUQ74789.1 HNH endonuclease [Phaeobacter piscinae]
MIKDGEEWKMVPSAPDILASSLGRVWVRPCTRALPNGGTRTYNAKPTYGYADGSATSRADSPKRRIIRVNRLSKTFKVHQLVCEAFHGPKPFPKAIVLHMDEDPSNNRPENLRWGTRKENQHFPKAKAAFKARTGDKSCWAIHRRTANAS